MVDEKLYKNNRKNLEGVVNSQVQRYESKENKLFRYGTLTVLGIAVGAILPLAPWYLGLGLPAGYAYYRYKKSGGVRRYGK